MRYIKGFKIFESNTDDYFQDFISILSQLEDDYDLIIETNNEITYYCSDTDGAYDGYSFTIKADPSIEIFNFDKSFTNILEKIERYADSIDHKIVIDPENRSMEYLTIKDFIDSYSGEELTEIDIIVYKYYDDLNESMLHFSPKFRNIIKSISGNKVADSLLKAELTDVKPDMTLIDVGDNPGEITFMQINKADKKIKDFIPTIDINSPDSGTSIETLYWYDMKKKSGSEISSTGIYIDPSRNKTSIGKFANKVFPGQFSQKEIEDFTNLFKSESDDKDNFKIVEGEEIRKWYRSENYKSDKKGTLSGSCMNGGDYVDLYIINPDSIKMIILLEDDKILGRAILWKIDGQEFKYLLDRIYYNEDHIVEKFISYAKKNDWAHKTKQTHSSFEDITFRGEDKNIKIELKVRNLHKYFPYVDTFQFINIDNRILYNYYDNDVTHRLESTHGGKTALKAWSKYNNKYLKILDAVWSGNRKDYLTREQAVNHDGDWYLEEDLLYSEWGEYYIVKGNEVKSEKLDSLLDRNRSKEVIMDEEGNKDWLPNRMEYTDFIYYDKEYYNKDLCILDYNSNLILKSNSTEIRILTTNKWGEIPLSKELYESIKYLYEYMGVKIFTTDWESSEVSYTDDIDYLYTRMCYIINPFYLVDEIENLSRYDDFKFGKVVELYQKFKDFLKSDIANRGTFKEKKFIYQYFGKESVDKTTIDDALLYELSKLYRRVKQVPGYELSKNELIEIMYEVAIGSYNLENYIYKNHLRYIFPELNEFEGMDLAYFLISSITPLIYNDKINMLVRI